MTETIPGVRIRPLDELDISDIVAIDEKISGRYRPEVWESRIGYYLRRDPEASVVAESGGEVVGFMLCEVRSGECIQHLGMGRVLKMDESNAIAARRQAVDRAANVVGPLDAGVIGGMNDRECITRRPARLHFDTVRREERQVGGGRHKIK